MPKKTESENVLPLADSCGVLETLGYEIINREQSPIASVVAGHRMSLKIVLLVFADAVKVDSFWPITRRVESDPGGFFTFINSLNVSCSMVTCCLDRVTPRFLRFRALLLGPFDRLRFTEFMEVWKRDIEEVFRTVISEDPGFLEH